MRKFIKYQSLYFILQVPGTCEYPCQCTNPDIQCKGGVKMVKDGCDCCFMCARQQGDVCDHRAKCDEDKQLYCDYEMQPGRRGICRGRVRQ